MAKYNPVNIIIVNRYTDHGDGIELKIDLIPETLDNPLPSTDQVLKAVAEKLRGIDISNEHPENH